MPRKRKITRAEADAQIAELAAAARKNGDARFEDELALGALVVQLQLVYEACDGLEDDRHIKDVIEEDFRVDYSRGVQFAQFYRVDRVLQKGKVDRLVRESYARVVAPLLYDPELLKRVVRCGREIAKKEKKALIADHLKAARWELDPDCPASYAPEGAREPTGEGTAPGDVGVQEGPPRDLVAAVHAPSPVEGPWPYSPEAGGASAPESESHGGWPWGEDARDRFARVPKRLRADVRESIALASLSVDVTPETVDEALEVVLAERDAPAGRKGWPVVVGVAVAVVAHNRRQFGLNDHPELLGPGLPHEPIADIDFFDDDYLVPADAEDYTAPDGPRAPLLVVVPTALCPGSLLDAHPGAREKVDGRAEVVVEVGELDAFDGPFLDVLDEHGHRALDLRAIREASAAAGIHKVVHPAGPGIEWAKWAVNCCTGCSHRCAKEFCYASDFALLYFPQAFVPTVWPARLDAFENSDPPDPESLPDRLRAWGRTVFHGSMTDLMNTAFPNYWVEAVIEAVARSPKWTVVVLTKLAPRLTDFVWPANAVVGVTVTGPSGVRAAAKALGALRGGAETWVSVEPFFEGFDPAPLLAARARFFAVGAQTPTRWAGEVQPSAKDVAALWYAVVSAGACFFPKSNLDHRGHIPFGGADPYAGWAPDVAERDSGPAHVRRAVRPKGPGRASGAGAAAS